MSFTNLQVVKNNLPPSADQVALTPTASGVSIEHFGHEQSPVKQALITLSGVAQSVVNGTEHQGTKIVSFPQGRFLVLGVTATLQQTTTSVPSSTINGGSTGAVALGTATSSSTTLNSTMADLLPSTAFVSSTTQNVAGAAVSGALAASAQFNGTSTAIDMYLNSAYATTTDVDADGTQTWSGTILITYINLGDY